MRVPKMGQLVKIKNFSLNLTGRRSSLILGSNFIKVVGTKVKLQGKRNK